MQHDLFHIYTVDAHTLRLSQVHAALPRDREGREDFPVAATLIHQLPKLGAAYGSPGSTTISPRAMAAIIR